MEFVIIMILFDVTDYRLLYVLFDIVQSAFGENINMTFKIFAYVHHLMFSVLKLVWIPICCLDRVESLMFQNLLESANNTTK